MELFHLLLSSLCFEHLATPSLPYNLSQSNLNLDNGIDATTAEDSTEGRDKLVVFHPFKNVLTEISIVFTAISTTLSHEFIGSRDIDSDAPNGDLYRYGGCVFKSRDFEIVNCDEIVVDSLVFASLLPPKCLSPNGSPHRTGLTWSGRGGGSHHIWTGPTDTTRGQIRFMTLLYQGKKLPVFEVTTCDPSVKKNG